MVGFEWSMEDPPPSFFERRGKYAEMLEEITSRPGQWARIPMTSPSGAGSLAREVRRGKKAPGKWDTVSRTIDGVYYTYIKYIGPE